MSKLSDSQIAFGQWWLLNREEVVLTVWRAAWGISFVLMAVVAGIWGWYGYQVWRLAPASPINEVIGQIPLATIQKRFPQTISLASTQVVANLDGTVTLLAPVKNPNPDFVATVTYVYTVNNVAQNPKTQIILPEQETYLTLNNYRSSSAVSAAVNLTEIKWQRVNNRIFWPFAFTVSDTELTPISIPNATTPNSPATVTGWISQFNYRHSAYETLLNAPVQIVATRSGAIIGIQDAIISNSPVDTNQTLRLNWPVDLSGDIAFKIIPNFDAFNSNYYLPSLSQINP